MFFLSELHINNTTFGQERMKQFSVVTMSALAVLTTLDDVVAITVHHGNMHHNGHSTHETCVRVHSYLRCHGYAY